MSRVKASPGGPAMLAGMDKVRIEQHSSLGLIWAAGWLFTIGFLKLGFWQGVFAIVIWPYYIGTWVAALAAGA